MTNKYSEGNVGKRYYGGNEFIDEIEQLCIDRALQCFGLDKKEWGVNVQTLSGTPANLQVYAGLLKPNDRIMALDLPDGGHLSHGFSTPTKIISKTAMFFNFKPYYINRFTEQIDYDQLEYSAGIFQPNMIIAGASAYSRLYDYERMYNICNNLKAYLFVDMAHISGLVASKSIPSPFEYADVVSTTTHKGLRGPRGAMIFFRKHLEDKINFSVFPGLQGGPHNHTIAALATALHQANSPEFKIYQEKVLKNTKRLAFELRQKKYRIVSGGTDNHLFLIDVRDSYGIDGARVEKVMEKVGIIINKNTVCGDKNAHIPSGIRIGTHAITTRGFREKDMETIACFIDNAVQLAKQIQVQTQGNKLKDFIKTLETLTDSDSENLSTTSLMLYELKDNVYNFVRSFPTIGFDSETMIYKN